MDHYKKTGNDEIHLMQLIISFLIVISLGVIVAMILQRSLNRDLNNIEMSTTRRKQIREQRLEAKRDGASAEEIASLTKKQAGVQLEGEDVAWKKL